MGATDKEEWRDIPGWEGLYQASSHGNIRSFHSGKPKVVVGGVTSDGYQLVILYRGQGKGRTGHNVHRLVCSAFNGAPDDGMEAAHLDGDRRNNVPGNLIWATRAENLSHRHAHGTILRGERQPLAKLTEEQVKEIWSSPLPGRILAERYGVSVGAIDDIRSRKNWSYLTATLPAQPHRPRGVKKTAADLPPGFAEAVKSGTPARKLGEMFKIARCTAFRYRDLVTNSHPTGDIKGDNHG